MKSNSQTIGKPSRLGNILRYAVIGLLTFVMVILLFSEPAEHSEHWTEVLIATKAAGIAVGYVIYRLIDRWDRAGKIPALSLKDEEGE